MDVIIPLIALDRRMRMSIARRRLRDVLNPFDVPENEFRSLYIMPQYIANDLIDEIEPFAGNLAEGIPLHLQVLCALNFYANGYYQKRVGRDGYNCLSQSVASKCIRNISEIISSKLGPIYIRFPVFEEEVNEKMLRFEEKYEMKGVIGLIDCTHIPITALPSNIEMEFVNRKGFHSINTQIICNADMHITNINARYSGSTHESHVWGCSKIFLHLEEKYQRGFNGSFLLGDSGYPLQPWLLTPIKRPVDSIDLKYNNRHKHTRSLVENTIGLLKGRFRCLLRERKLRYNVATNITNSCVVLHNFLMKKEIALNGEIIRDAHINAVAPKDNYNRVGHAITRQIAETL